MSDDAWLKVADKFGVIGVYEMNATPADIENMCRAIATARSEAERLRARVAELEKALTFIKAATERMYDHGKERVVFQAVVQNLATKALEGK